MSELAAIPWEAIGLSGMAVFAVYLVLTGKIVPAKDRDDWREQARQSEQARQASIAELGNMNRSLHALATQKELGVAMLQSVRDHTETPPHEEGS